MTNRPNGEQQHVIANSKSVYCHMVEVIREAVGIVNSNYSNMVNFPEREDSVAVSVTSDGRYTFIKCISLSLNSSVLHKQ